MHGRAIAHLVAFAMRVVVGDRDRLVMGDQEAVIGTFERRPAPDARRRARAIEKDRGAAAEFVAAAIGRKMPLMRAPAELGRLHAFGDEAVDRPGVDEFARLFRDARDCVSRSAMWMTLTPSSAASAAHSRRPFGAAVMPASSARSSSATLMKCDTRPGLAPWVTTAVGPSGFLARERQARSRAARSWSAARARGRDRYSRRARARCRCRDRARPLRGTARSARGSRPRPTR